MNPKHDQSPAEHPIYSRESLASTLESVTTTDQMRAAARYGFGELNIGGKPLYIGQRKPGGKSTSSGYTKDGVPALFIGHGDRTVDEARTGSVRFVLSMFRRSQLGIGPETPMVAQPSDEFKKRRLIPEDALKLVVDARMTGDTEAASYVEGYLPEIFEHFVGEPVPEADIEDLIVRTQDYTEYFLNAQSTEQPQA